MSYNAPIPSTPTPRLRRSTTNSWFGGVCGGIAERFGMSAGLVRTLFVVSIVLPGPQFLVYIALWIVIPRD